MDHETQTVLDGVVARLDERVRGLDERMRSLEAAIDRLEQRLDRLFLVMLGAAGTLLVGVVLTAIELAGRR